MALGDRFRKMMEGLQSGGDTHAAPADLANHSHNSPAPTRRGYTADSTLVNTGLQSERFTGAASNGFMNDQSLASGPFNGAASNGFMNGQSMGGTAPRGASSNGFMNDQSMGNTQRNGFTAPTPPTGSAASLAAIQSLASKPDMQVALNTARRGGANVTVETGQSTPNGVPREGGPSNVGTGQSNSNEVVPG